MKNTLILLLTLLLSGPTFGQFYTPEEEELITRDREPLEEHKALVKEYFEKWYSESTPLPKKERKKLDKEIRRAYQVYEALFNEKNESTFHSDKKGEYFLVPGSITLVLLDEKEKEIKKIEIDDFRPRIHNRKALYYTKKRKESFPDFGLKYGVEPHLSINSHMMSGKNRFFETCPFVDEISLIENSTQEFQIDYSYGSMIKYGEEYKIKRGKITFLSRGLEVAVD